jgi:hypothetical protein
MERTTGSETKSKIVVFVKEWSTTVIPFANYIMSQIAESPSTAVVGCLRLIVMAWTSVASGQLLYSRWKTRVIGLCSGLKTLAIMVPSAARV